MTKTITTTLLTLILFTHYSMAQSSDETKTDPAAHLGFGIGLTYGGLGSRLVLNLTDGVGISGGVGYNFVGTGYNFALLLSPNSKTRTKAYFSGMYGTNTVLIIEGADDLNKSYTGVSLGMGMQIKSKSGNGNYLELGIIVPIRSSEYQDDIDDINRSNFINLESEPWPVLINIGYNIKFG